MEVGDLVISKDGLVGELKKQEIGSLYYVEGYHDLAGKWVTGYDYLQAFKKTWKVYKKGTPPK